MQPFREDAERKEKCRETARAIAHGQSPQETLELLEKLGVSPLPSQSFAPAGTPQGQLSPISIYEPVEVDGKWVFKRPPIGPFGDHYATRDTIALDRHPGTTRICYFGESAAAGYLYAPHMTPARVLQHQLNELSQSRQHEVIDLSRTNERIPSLVNTFERALQLAPDVMVIYTGNNWNLLEAHEVSPLVPDETHRRTFGKKLRESGVDGVLNNAAKTLIKRIDSAFSRMAFLARNARVDVIVVVPQVNLADWESHQPPPCLTGENLRLWYDAFFRAVSMLEQNRWSEARDAAMKMLEYDGGTSPTPFCILAHGWAGDGKLENAREAARAEIDAVSYATLCFLDAPRANTLALNIQRRLSHIHGFHLVDLPVVFAEHTGNLYAGKRMFLDYCHLSFEGMRVAMAPITAQILHHKLRETLTWQDVYQQVPGPQVPPETHALAHLGAAIHSAHRENAVTPKTPRLVHWLKEATESHPEVVETMLDYARARVARAPAVMTPAQAEVLSGKFPLNMQHGWRYDHIDAQLLSAMFEVLDDETSQQLQDLIVQKRQITEDPLDLSDPYYLWEPLNRFYPEVMGFDDMPTPALHRSPWPFSSFALISDGDNPIKLDITACIPGSRADETHPVAVCVNEQSIAALNFTKNWRRHTATVPPHLLRRGLNQLTLCWPVLPTTTLGGTRRALDRLDRGLEGHLHPVFGEVSALKAWKIVT